MVTIINIDTLICDGCPALELKHEFIEKIKNTEKQREENGIAPIIRNSSRGRKIKLYLLCESPPANRFFYDFASEYKGSGLRYSLRNELVDGKSDAKLRNYIYSKGIVVMDCALCPLHRLSNKNKSRKERCLAATLCFINNTCKELTPEVPIITIFPKRMMGLNKKIPEDFANRVKNRYSFSELKGLKEEIERILAK